MAIARRETTLSMTPWDVRGWSGAVLMMMAALAAPSTVACANHQGTKATSTPPLPTPPPPKTDADARGLTEFSNRVQAYVALHQKVEAGLPNRPDRSDPTKVAVHQKALAEGIRKSGPRPAQGHVFIPDIQPFFKRLLAAE